MQISEESDKSPIVITGCEGQNLQLWCKGVVGLFSKSILLLIQKAANIITKKHFKLENIVGISTK